MKRETSLVYNQVGAIMVLMALLIVVVVLSAALAIDIAIMGTTKQKTEDVASGLALGALERSAQATDPEIVNPPCTSSGGWGYDNLFECQRDRARVRAQELISLSANTLLGKALTHDSTPPPAPKLCFADEIGSTSGCMNEDETAGTIRAGRYWFEEPHETCTGYTGAIWYNSRMGRSCPCTSGAWNGECFQEWSPADPGTKSVNSFMVELRTPASAPMSTVFGKIAGLSTSTTQGRAVATVLPKHAIILADLSPSTQLDTHVLLQGSEPPPPIDLPSTVAALPLSTTLSCSSPEVSTSCVAGCSFPSPVLGPYVWYYEYPSGQLNIPDSRSTPPAHPDVTLFTTHYKDDYACYAISYQICDTCSVDPVTGDESCSSCSPQVTDSYLVDSFYDGAYSGPQPLTAILDAISETASIFEDRGISNDLLGVIAFDTTGNIIKDTGYPAAGSLLRRFPLSPIGSPVFDKLKEATNTAADDPTYPQNRFEHFLFPRLDTSTGTARAIRTNFPQALMQASNSLAAAPNSDSAESFVIMFSDGKTNCALSLCGTPGGCCQNNLTYHTASAQESFDILSLMAEQRIAFHAVFVGDASGPHTLAYGNGGGGSGCISDEDARILGLNYVDPVGDGVPVNPDDPSTMWPPPDTEWGATPFFSPNVFWEWSRNTNGLWAPVRTPCPSGSAAALDSACNAAGEQALITNITVSGQTVVDGEGRVLCDPQGRTKAQQVQDTIQRIFETNPYVLKEEL